MKIKDGFLLREVADQTIVLPGDDSLDLNMVITLNDTGKFLWQLLEQGSDEASMVSALLAEYDVDRETAEKSVSGFVAKLKKYDFVF